MLASNFGRKAATVIWLLVSIVAASAVPTLIFDEHQEDLFRTDAEAFAHYQKFIEHYPAEQSEISLLISGPILNADSLSTLLRAQTQLEHLPALEYALSILTVPTLRQLASQASDGDTSALATLKDTLANPNYWPGRLVSNDGLTTVIVVSLATNGDNSAATLQQLLKQLDQFMVDALEGSALSVSITGFPALRIALRQQIKRDTFIFSLSAMFLSVLVAWLYFRSLQLVTAALIGPLTAIIWTFAGMALLGLSINVLTQMVGVLILVITFSDALHIVEHIRRFNNQASTTTQIISSTIKRLGPACWLTSLTTAAGFASLMLSASPNVRQFGLICALGTLVGFIAVMLSTPVMTFLCQRTAPIVTTSHAHGTRTRHRPLLDKFVVALGLALTLVLLVTAIGLKPDYNFTENLSRNNPTTLALAQGDRQLGGQLPLQVLLQWPTQSELTREDMLRQIANVQSHLEQTTQQDWLSVNDLLDVLPGPGNLTKLNQIPPDNLARFYQFEQRSAVISTQVPSTGMAQVRGLIEQISDPSWISDATDLSKAPTVAPAGFLNLVSQGSLNMISDLGKSLFTAVVLILLINIVLFRSWRLGLVSFAPNIAPIAAVAAVLVWVGEPLRYSSVVLFSICLGLAVDDSVHMITRFRQLRASGIDVITASFQARSEVGRVLVLTTAIMCAGFSALLFSSTPAIVTMGMLACAALLVALVFDLVMLPALLRRFH